MITPSFNLTATERVLPKLALDFTTASLDSRVTFTRSGNTATVINSNGLVAGVNADVPRFDYDPITLVCKGLLIEESRSNLYTYSANLADASWVTSSCTTLANQVTAPDGTTTAARATFSANGLLYKNTVPNAAGTYSLSVWLRSATGSNQSIRFFGNGATTFSTVQTVTTSWQRFTFTYTYSSATSGFTTASGGTADVYIWGAQCEAGAFATSYIPTTNTVPVTRNADSAVMTGTNFTSWFSASEGTLMTESQTLVGASEDRAFFITDASPSSNIIALEVHTANGFSGRVNASASIQVGFGSGNVSGTVYKQAMAYKANDFAYAKNGGTISTDTVGNLPVVDRACIGANGAPTSFGSGIIKKISYWPQRLTNAEVQAFSK